MFNEKKEEGGQSEEQKKLPLEKETEKLAGGDSNDELNKPSEGIVGQKKARKKKKKTTKTIKNRKRTKPRAKIKNNKWTFPAPIPLKKSGKRRPKSLFLNKKAEQ